jgi:hypothetical protein
MVERQRRTPCRDALGGYDPGVDLPNDDRLRWLLTRSAWLLERGCEPVRGLVEPTARFFPERPDGTAEAMRALFARTVEHAGLGDVDLDVSIHVPDQDPLGGGSCSTGACGTPKQKGDKGPPLLGTTASGYAVALPGALAGAPPLLGAHLTRIVAAMFLHEADAITGLDRREVDGAVDLAATWLGFGVIVANGSHVVSKSCGGIRVTRATTLPVEEIGVALAMFAARFGVEAEQARRHLEPTPREAFDEGAAWVRANASTVRLLETSPRAIEEGAYRLKPARGWLARTFGFGAKKAPADALEADDDELVRELARAQAARPARPVDAAREARLARARAVVDDALAEE